MSQLLKFQEARTKVWNLDLKNYAEYVLYQQQPNIAGLPSNPKEAYGEEYVSDSDWIGWHGSFWCYSRAKEFVAQLDITSMSGWWACRKKGLCPSTIPSNPNTVYDEWDNWPSFLGYEKVNYVTYEEARELVKDLGLATMVEYKKWWRENDGQSKGLPLTPNSVYKAYGWEGSKSFLGYSKRRSNSREYLPFEEAREFMKTQDLTSHAEWIQWCRNNDRPRNIPSAPDVKYKKEWKGFPHFLGYEYEYPVGRIRNAGRVEVMDYEEAKDYIQEKGFTSQAQFAEWSKTVDRPVNFPSSPNRKYRDSGWEGFAKFLGYWVEKEAEEEEDLNIIGQVGNLFGVPLVEFVTDMKREVSNTYDSHFKRQLAA